MRELEVNRAEYESTFDFEEESRCKRWCKVYVCVCVCVCVCA